MANSRRHPRTAVLALALAGLIATAASASAQAWRLGPDRFSLRHPTLPSIAINSTGPDLPTFAFFASPDFAGPPVWLLDSRGLVIDGDVRCRWRDWGDGERLLEAPGTANDLRVGRPCGAPIPIRTRVTDGGLGSPALFFAVSSVRGHVVELRLGRRAVFFDARTLPGRAYDWSEAPQPSFGSPDGPPGWDWLKSQRWRDETEGAQLAARLRDPAFARFYHGLRGCLTTRAPGCLVQYLHEDFTITPWWSVESDEPGEPPAIDRKTFARRVWQAATPGWQEAWQELAWCFLRGRFEASELSFWRGFVVCRVAATTTGYAITTCDATD